MEQPNKGSVTWTFNYNPGLSHGLRVFFDSGDFLRRWVDLKVSNSKHDA